MGKFTVQSYEAKINEIYETCREYLNNVDKYLKIPKKQILEHVFQIQDIRLLKKEIEKYKWGVLEALESYVEFPAYLFKEKLFSARAPRGKQSRKFIRNNILLIKKAVAIQETFSENFAKEPELEFLKNLWKGKLEAFLTEVRLEINSSINLEALEQFLAKRNIFIFYFYGATISGLATKNFIFINGGESKARQIWTLFHELLHILNRDFAFRTPGDKKESQHEEEVGSFLIEDFLPKHINDIKPEEVDYIVEEVFEKNPLKIHKYAIEKWISKKIKRRLKFERFYKRGKKQNLKEEEFKLIPSQSYLELIDSIKGEDLEVYASLLGLSLEELLMEQPDILEV